MTASTGPKTVTGLRWTRRHLLGLADLSAGEITSILDQAEEFKRLAAAGETKLNALAGTVVANLFFENSTRTRTSFSLAAKRLSADTIDFSSSGSSLSKGKRFSIRLETSRRWARLRWLLGIARRALRICWQSRLESTY